jgi:hypothetical protein
MDDGSEIRSLNADSDPATGTQFNADQDPHFPAFERKRSVCPVWVAVQYQHYCKQYS